MPILPGVPSSGGFRLPLDELEALLKERVPVHTPDVAVKESIEEDVDGALHLVGDAAAPGASKYYGTDGGGVRGYYSFPSFGYTPETWAGAAMTVQQTDLGPKTSDHTLAAVAPNDTYLIDCDWDWWLRNTRVVRVKVDPTGASGFTTVSTYEWADFGRADNNIAPLTFVVTGQSMQAGGILRLELEQTVTATADPSTLIPRLVRGT